jgi:PIN domain nuclease of toxin-antitoxin system
VPTLAVTDTHALIWAATGPSRLLGKRARKMFDEVEQGRAALYVPTIVLVEIGEAVQKGAVELGVGFEAWTKALLSSGRYHPVDLTPAIVLRAQSLFAIPERGDRLIAATAAELDCPLITRDPAITAAAGVDILW